MLSNWCDISKGCTILETSITSFAKTQRSTDTPNIYLGWLHHLPNFSSDVIFWVCDSAALANWEQLDAYFQMQKYYCGVFKSRKSLSNN